MSRVQPTVVVIGGGVIGLTTGIRLAESGHHVRLLTAEAPEQTTSAAASAMWALPPEPPGDRRLSWAQASLPELQRLAAAPDQTGVHLADGVLASRAAGEFAPAVATMPGFRPLTGGLPPGFEQGAHVEAPLLDMPRYLPYLVARFQAAGGDIQQRRVDSLSQAAAGSQAIVNCVGVEARNLVPDPLVRPLFGQHVLVENPGLTDFFMEGPRITEWVGIYPFERHVVLGGVAVPDRWERAPDPALGERILARCIEVEPRLERARIIGHNAGLRPARPHVRLEAETVDGVRCVHNYGHGTLGVGLAWGCADEAATLALN